jgi:hypothetical protein
MIKRGKKHLSLNHENIWKEITDLDKQIRDLEKKAEYLKKIEKQLANSQYSFYKEEVSELRRYLKDLNSFQKVKELHSELLNKFTFFKKQSIKLKEQLKNLPSTFFISDIENIERLLSNPSKIDEAKEKISEISKDIDSRKKLGFPLELSQYTDIFLIGSGGFAYVYGAKRVKDGKNVAIKIPKTYDKNIGKSFIRELNNWVGLKHPNIVEIFDYNILPSPYLEMEICDFSLDKMKIPMKILDAMKLIREICNGIKYAHKKKIVHLDLKPQNILLKDGIPKISDWGMSKLITEQGMTTLGLSLPFAAPEQFSDKFGEKDEQTDIWQLGVLLHYLITGKLLFTGSDYVEYAEKITNKNIDKSLKKSDSSFDISSIINECLEKDKRNRYKTITYLQKDLEKLGKNLIKENDIRNRKILR